MKLDIRKIIDLPGGSLPFDFQLDTERLDFLPVKEYSSAPRASGRVFNEAGILRLQGAVDASMVCVCDRCGELFDSVKTTDVDVVLAEEENDDNPDLFLIEGGTVDLDDVMATCFILDMESKFLCSEECKGLCPTCGHNLNLGPCGCRKPIDPRFAVLEQLLDDKE